MKRFFLLIIGVFSLVSMINCASVRPLETRQIQRQWMLISMGNFSKEELAKNKAEINLTATLKEGKIQGTAFMGCNRMFFSTEIKTGNKINISGLGSTLMACENMAVETQFSKSFEQMSRYEIDGHFLTLSDDSGNSMKFVAADWD